MKISKYDKEEILRKVINTLIESLRSKNFDPNALLLKCYTTWFDKEVAPFKKNPLFDLIPSEDRCRVHIKDTDGTSLPIYELHSTTNPLSYTLDTITGLEKRELPTNYKLINTGDRQYYSTITIKLNAFPLLATEIKKHMLDMGVAQVEIRTQAHNLSEALNTVNTYKQLKDRLPVIFNAMPNPTKQKYADYQARIRQARTKKNEPLEEIGDFSALGTTLAVASLKENLQKTQN